MEVLTHTDLGEAYLLFLPWPNTLKVSYTTGILLPPYHFNKHVNGSVIQMAAEYSSKISEMMHKPKRTPFLYQKLQSEPENSYIKSVDMKFQSFETLLSEI
jgi:hypothetical protein